jgi:cytochrome c oxidase subunit II
MFSDATNLTRGVDVAFMVTLVMSLALLILITGLMIYFAIKYSRKNNPNPSKTKSNMKLEIIWTVVPTILVMLMFYYGYIGYKQMAEIPEGAMEIKVVGKMWAWSFEYPNGKLADELWIPVGIPVKLEITSQDVIHSFYVPAFRQKKDAVPGKKNYMWFISNEPAVYDIFCAEYCGDRHAYMYSKVNAVTETEYTEWLNKPDEFPGRTLVKIKGCISCHSLDGSKKVGPSFKGLFGREEVVILPDGSEKKIKVDEEYVTKSIWEPEAEVVKGYENVMPSQEGLLKQEELRQIIDYLNRL